MTTGSAFRSGELLWRERMSTSTIVLGWLGVAFGLLVLGVGVARTLHPVDTSAGPVYVVVGLAIAWFSLAGSLLPVVESRSAGIYVRNVLHETWVPWAAVVQIVPNARVNVILDAGRFVGAWAVQPGGGRVDAVVERLTADWRAGPRGEGGAEEVRRVSWPPASAVAVVAGYVVVVLAVSLATG
ncbi:hypothetical protein [Cellulomonas sp. URHD0024]|uniref:hypothetical protein n=1 Tax=Cellulomonas sp. URHD0024 TaxID=1302620 RepID=UPI00040F393F|nr:hypothetical protein [Cellulomonas sp. URHD0024]